MIGAIADLHFAPTTAAAQELRKNAKRPPEST
jgi:UDP-N-acetylglucosamine 2-epimerase